MKLPEFPVTIKKAGYAPVRIYQHDNGGYTEYKVAHYVDGKRKLETFSDFEKARNRADKVFQNVVAHHDPEANGVSREDRIILHRATTAINGLGVELDTVARDYADAVKRLGAVPLREAVSFYLKHNVGTQSRTVRQVVDELIEAKRNPSKNKKPASEKYLTDLESRLGKFEESFQCNIGDVRADQILEFLDDLPDISGHVVQLCAADSHAVQLRAGQTVCATQS